MLFVMLLWGCAGHGNNVNGEDTLGSDSAAETETDTTDTTGEAQTTEPDDGFIEIVENGVAKYRIIRPEKADLIVRDMAVNLRSSINQVTGTAPDLVSDWSKPGEEPADDAPEILIGIVNRRVTSEMYSQFTSAPESEAYGTVICIDSKIVIFGTDSTMVKIAVEWFEDNIVFNTQYAGEGRLIVPSDINYTIKGSDLSPSYFIDPDAENSVKIEFKAKVLSSGNHMILQGACTDGEYAYVVLENQKVSPSVGIIRKIDLKTWKTVKDSEPLAIDHGNDLAYNPNTGLIVAVHNAPNRNKISFIDPQTLTVVDTKTIGYEIYSIAYNSKTDRYALGLSHGYNLVVVDSDFNYVGKKIIIGVNTGFTKQGMDSDDEYLYFVQSWDNCIVIYDWSGNYIKTINFNDVIKDETEAIFHIGGSFYITFNIDYKTHGAIYKVDVTEK